MPKPILNVADVELRRMGHGAEANRGRNAPEKFRAQTGDIGRRIGARKLGYNVTVVPPGHRAWPFHSHRVNEEMFFILEGEGEVRIGQDTFAIRGRRDRASAGRRRHRAQIVNTSNAELKYLAVSTMEMPEVCDYPDSGKFAVMNVESGPDGKPRFWRHAAREKDGVDYWDGE